MKANCTAKLVTNVEVNNRGRAVRTLSTEAPTPGQDMVLELDIELQKRRLKFSANDAVPSS